MATPYELLGVPENATQEAIRVAYKRALADAHPDRNGGDDARAKLLGRAFGCVGDPEARAAYDARLRRMRAREQVGQQAGEAAEHVGAAAELAARFLAGEVERAVAAFLTDPRARAAAEVFEATARFRKAMSK